MHLTVHSFAMLLLLALLACASHLVSGFSIKYDMSVSLSPAPASTLYFRVNRTDNRVDLALEIQRPLSVRTTWVGIGISDPTSSGLRGADLYTVQFIGNGNDTCNTLDQYVPFVAYPFNVKPQLKATPDVNRTDTWKPGSCKRYANGTILVEVTRKIIVPSDNNQDNPIGAGAQNVVHAYGEGAEFRLKNQFSTEVVFFSDSNGTVVQQPELPIDASGTFEVIAERSNTANFNCFTTTAPSPKSGRMVVAVDAVVKTPFIMRIVVYGCEKSDFFTNNFNGTAKCNLKNRPFVLGLETKAVCNTIFYTWAPGTGRLVFPREAGLSLGKENQVLVMEVTSTEGYVAGDANVTLHYTDRPRKFRAGTLALGDPAYFNEGEFVRDNGTTTFYCSRKCTNYFNSSINVFASRPQLGRYGHSILLQRADIDKLNVSLIQHIRYWDHEVQRLHYFKEPVSIMSGETIATTCNYSISKTSPSTVRYGPRDIDESCMAYLYYWPVQERVEGDGSLFYCGVGYDRGGVQRTLCGAGFKSNRLISLGDDVPCFPPRALVTLADGTTRAMRDVRIGDRVLVGNAMFSEVFMFTHRNSAAEATFVQISLADGKSITLTLGHYLYCNGKLVPAKDVRIGDALLDEGGKSLMVVSIRRKQMQGLYNPQTLHGDIVVDGVLASTYTTAAAPGAAHALLLPLRGAVRSVGMVISAYFDGATRLRSYASWCSTASIWPRGGNFVFK